MGTKPFGGLHVLHVLGVSVDEGGVLSVVRSLHATPSLSDVRHSAVVSEHFVQTREPSLKLVRCPDLIAEAHGVGIFLTKGAKAASGLKQIIKDLRPDVIHVHYRGALIPALYLEMRHQLPLLFTNHAYARRNWLYRLAARRPHVRTVALTPNMLKHYSLRAKPGKIDVVSACFDERFLSEPLVAARLPAAALKIVAVGSIVRWKNWGLVLEALKLLTPDQRAQISFEHWGPVTQGTESETFAQELLAKTANYGLAKQVVWRGPTNDVLSKLQAANLFLLPSNNEPCSVALTEAMSLGLPVVASRSGGNVDIVADGRTGVLFEMDNAASLAEKLAAILSGQVTFVSPSEIRASVLHRSSSVVGEQYGAIYREMAEPTRKAIARL